MTMSGRFWTALGGAAFVCLLSHAPLDAAEPAGTNAPRAPTIVYHKYELPNGLQVILSEDHRLPLVAVNIWYHVGPANERPGRTGFAHRSST